MVFDTFCKTCFANQNWNWTNKAFKMVTTNQVGSKEFYVLLFKELFMYWIIARITKPLEIVYSK